MTEKIRLYLDNCSFNRPFDDQSQLRIKLETEAKLAIQTSIINRKYELVWSYILDYENEQNPYEERKISIKRWSHEADVIQKENESLLIRAEYYVKKGLKSKDALHVSCAIEADCEYFITTDDKIIKNMSSDDHIKAINPLNFIQIFGE
jgi:predicted nucleic acid-binding protein